MKLSAQQSDLILQARALGLASDGENAFWSTANTYGRNYNSSLGVFDLSGVWGKYFTDDLRLIAGASVVGRLNKEEFLEEDHESAEGQFNQYFAGIRWGKVELLGGAWQRPEQLQGLSSANGDLLWSNNTLAPPGVVLQTAEPVRVIGPLSIEGAFGNYWMTNERVVIDAMIHYKQGTAHVDVGQSGRFSLGLHHYVQWGGFHTRGLGQQPQGFSDFLRVVLGKEGGENATGNDQANKLGNHIGSWRIGYRQQLNQLNARFYYHTFAEDETGVDIRNFPDGLWGIYLEAEDPGLFSGLVLEYLQGTFQGGPIEASGGGDNYFNNSIYLNGWTYAGATIGTPFFSPRETGTQVDNLVDAYHLGVGGVYKDLSYRLLASYSTNYGWKRSRYPEPIETFSSALELNYQAGNSQFNLMLASDLINVNPNRFTLGVGYRYRFTSGCRTGECGDLLQFLE